jgi:hypothetical protein
VQGNLLRANGHVQIGSAGNRHMVGAMKYVRVFASGLSASRVADLAACSREPDQRCAATAALGGFRADGQYALRLASALDAGPRASDMSAIVGAASAAVASSALSTSPVTPRLRGRGRLRVCAPYLKAPTVPLGYESASGTALPFMRTGCHPGTKWVRMPIGVMTSHTTTTTNAVVAACALRDAHCALDFMAEKTM